MNCAVSPLLAAARAISRSYSCVKPREQNLPPALVVQPHLWNIFLPPWRCFGPAPPDPFPPSQALSPRRGSPLTSPLPVPPRCQRDDSGDRPPQGPGPGPAQAHADVLHGGAALPPGAGVPALPVRGGPRADRASAAAQPLRDPGKGPPAFSAPLTSPAPPGCGEGEGGRRGEVSLC